ncbi:hypothetical protein DL96DRAFT_1724061 [Flagelloscypha sp. PMI_526]|nr:hypothetical protein DL96DRAFT_1724061 [Flagelloscypha sp. PMI_526]
MAITVDVPATGRTETRMSSCPTARYFPLPNPFTQQAGPSPQSPCPPVDVAMLDVAGKQEHNPSATDKEADSQSIDLDDDPPRLDRETFGQPSAPDFNFNFLDDIYPTEDVQFGYWRSSLSPYAEETGIPMEDVFEDRAFILLNTLNESDTRPNYAIYDEQRKHKADLPIFRGKIMTTVMLPLLAHVQTAQNSLSVPNADDFETLFGHNNWLNRFSNKRFVHRYAVEYSYEWSILQEIKSFVKDEEHMSLENIDVFAVPHNPGYIYLAGTEEELEALESYIFRLPLVCATAEPVSAEELESELAFPPAPDAYDLHPRDGEWVKVVRGLHTNDFVLSGISAFNHPLTPEQLFPLFHSVVVEQDGYLSFRCLIASSPFRDDGAEPHDLSFRLISADALPSHHVPSHLVNEVYTSKFSTLSSAVDVGSTVKLRCSQFSDTFSVVKAEDSGRFVLRPTGMSESTLPFCIKNVEALLIVDGPVYKRQHQLLAHFPPLFVQTKADEDINTNSSFHPFLSWHDLQGIVKGVRTTQIWEPSFPSGLMVTVGIDGSTRLVQCDLFDLALEDSAHRLSWLSDSKHRELDNTRGCFWTLLTYRLPPNVGILPSVILPTSKTLPLCQTTLPESNMPAPFHPDGCFPDPPLPVGVEDTTPPLLDVLRHPHLEGCWISFSLLSPSPSATKKEREGNLNGRIVNVDGVHYIRYHPGRMKDTKLAPLRSIQCLSSVGTCRGTTRRKLSNNTTSEEGRESVAQGSQID